MAASVFSVAGLLDTSPMELICSGKFLLMVRLVDMEIVMIIQGNWPGKFFKVLKRNMMIRTSQIKFL